MREESAATTLHLHAPQAAETPRLDADAVRAFLAANPDFFLQHPSLLADIELPHQSGSAVSLIERQVKLLRERNIESRTRLARLLETAQENDALFTKTRRLVLGLLEAASLEQLTQTLALGLQREFDIEHVRLLLIADAQVRWPESARPVERPIVEAALGGMLRQARPAAGPLRDAARTLLFGSQAAEIGSALVATITSGEQPVAVLALGSSNPGRFHSEMGTLFMEFVGEVMQRLLTRWQVRS